MAVQCDECNCDQWYHVRHTNFEIPKIMYFTNQKSNFSLKYIFWRAWRGIKSWLRKILVRSSWWNTVICSTDERKKERHKMRFLASELCLFSACGGFNINLSQFYLFLRLMSTQKFVKNTKRGNFQTLKFLEWKWARESFIGIKIC